MLNACACCQAFAIDSADRQLTSKAIISLYDNVLSAAGFSSNDHNIDIVRKCVLYLLSHSEVRDKWIELRLTTQTRMPRSLLMDQRDGTHPRHGVILLYPPFVECPIDGCGCALVSKHHKDTLTCYTLDGVTKVSTIILTCRRCEIDFHFDHYRVDGFRRYYDGSVQGEQRTRVFSPVLNKEVSIPDFIRVGNRYYSWEFMKAVTVQTILGRSSYGKTAALFDQYLNQRNLRHSSVTEHFKLSDKDSELLDAHLWWRLLSVCMRNFLSSSPRCSIAACWSSSALRCRAPSLPSPPCS